MEIAGDRPSILLHIRFFHLSKELSGIGGQRLHITALSLRINSVKGQRGFSGTGQAGQHNKLISWKGHIDIFQVVLIGALLNFDVLLLSISFALYSLLTIMLCLVCLFMIRLYDFSYYQLLFVPIRFHHSCSSDISFLLLRILSIQAFS